MYVRVQAAPICMCIQGWMVVVPWGFAFATRNPGVNVYQPLKGAIGGELTYMPQVHSVASVRACESHLRFPSSDPGTYPYEVPT
ncbi:hypothetical protein F5Y14DRAFT_249207 [Nemania sp. NC0429]|nr:hypothetical protein F5Y14DRAFT_249207 [Nemania sp. NC0429]